MELKEGDGSSGVYIQSDGAGGGVKRKKESGRRVGASE